MAALTVVVQDALLAAALEAGGVGAAVAGGGGAAGPQGPVGGLAEGPEAAALDAGRVGAAVAGGGVAGQTLVLREAAGAAAAGPTALVQVVHVQLQGVADVRLAVLLLLCVGHGDGLDIQTLLFGRLSGLCKSTGASWEKGDSNMAKHVTTKAF